MTYNPNKYDKFKNSGRFRHRITIQRKGRTEDDAGYPIPNPIDWEEVCKAWAGREVLKGREYYAAAAVQRENTVRWPIRYRADITADALLAKGPMRILHKGRAYDIYAVLDDVTGDRTETHLLTTEAL